MTQQTDPKSKIRLPPAPAHLSSKPVAAWSEPINIDSYLPADPHRFPAYLDNRVYQGSSGKVFPLPFFERIAPKKSPHQWQALHLENEWIRIMILPELGGRIHIAYDKVGDYDIFYRNNVIKPALVGLAGPWLSGGVEFNWPQHHRPATFLPVDWEIEYESDGSATVWCSDHDPFTRMKGMHGIRLRPDSSVIEARVRLFNRSDSRQSFLWWANVAAAVGDDYQSFFPRDVSYVADHARRAVTRFPHADRVYYGVDYAARAGHGDSDRIDWYHNIPVPTSYMVTYTADEFFGGYDHARQRGFVHWASKAVSPGKKQWTWGNAPFGWAWDANLTDTDGPYVELMAGIYTDNQPDFAFIEPGETKAFSQYWYPIRDMGPAQAATARGAISSSEREAEVDFRINVTENFPSSVIRVWDAQDELVVEMVADLSLDTVTTITVPISSEERRGGRVSVTCEGVMLVSMSLAESVSAPEPSAAVEPPAPADVQTIDELVHIAIYLDQYRHATRKSRPYWEEILSRDPQESRALLAVAQAALAQGRYANAARFAESSIARTTQWASTPLSGAAHYVLGKAAVRMGESESAIAAFSRASWDSAYFVPSSYQLARAYCRGGDFELAASVLESVIDRNPDHLQARSLAALVLRRQGRESQAAEILAESIRRDPLDAWTRHLLGLTPSQDPTILLDAALEYRSAGFLREALDLMVEVERATGRTPLGQVCVGPLALAYQMELGLALRDRPAAERAAREFQDVSLLWCLPSRLDDIDALFASLTHLEKPGKAHALLGHWLYDKGRVVEAREHWQLAILTGADDHDIAVVSRNLGIAAYNIDHDFGTAIDHYGMAMRFLPADAKLLSEFDQLSERAGSPLDERLTALARELETVMTRDDLVVTYGGLLCEAGRFDEALSLLSSRPFQPWEGGEGKVLDVWERACLASARRDLERGDPDSALDTLAQAHYPPASLGEARHPLANRAELLLAIGDAHHAASHYDCAQENWRSASQQAGDFSSMAPVEYSDRTYFSVLALRRLGMNSQADSLQEALLEWVERLEHVEAKVDFFATSLPDMLLFVDDPAVSRDRLVLEIRGQIAGLRVPS